jgi:hypothetical protein
MDKGNDIRMIYEAYLTDDKSEKPSHKANEIPEIGVWLNTNDRGDNDGDRYYTTVEIYPMSNKSGHGPPLDWDYLDRNTTLEDLVAQVKRNFKLTGKPKFD